MDVRVFKRSTGIEPFNKFLDGLRDRNAKSKIITAITRMESKLFGSFSSVGNGVQESKINYGPGYRIYFYFDGPALVILLCASDKDDQQKEIQRAKMYLEEYKIQKTLVTADKTKREN